LIDVDSCALLNVTPLAVWFEPGYWTTQNAIVGSAEGRGTTLFVKHQDQNLVHRHYCRGGMVRHINHDTFFDIGLTQSRPYRELTLLRYMHNLNLAVPMGVAGFVQRTAFGYRADLITARIPHSSDVHSHILNQPLHTGVWQNIGSAIRHMHNAQVYHHDLNIKNIMLDAQQTVWLIDFDRCDKRDGEQWKQANLQRLRRSLDKQKTKYPKYHFEEHDWQALVQGYRESSVAKTGQTS